MTRDTNNSGALVVKCLMLLCAVAVVLLAQPTAYAAVITEDFSTGDGDWEGSGTLDVIHDPGGFLVGSYNSSLFFPATETGGFRAETGASDQFTGNWSTIADFESIRFDFQSVNVIPDAFGLRFSYGTGIFTYFLTPGSIGTWSSYAVPVSSGAGWSGPTGASFESAISNVEWVEVFAFQGTAGDPLSGVPAQSFYLDNFEFSSEGIPVIPEPTHGVLFIFGVLMLMFLRQHRHGMQPFLAAFAGASVASTETPSTWQNTRASWKRHRVRHRRKMPLFVLPLRPY